MNVAQKFFCCCLLSVAIVPLAQARSVTINTVGGPITIDIGHIGPSGSLVSPQAPTAPRFGPPSIFSAPLPSGSGARAIGVAGAFTAEADDATAASWNPGGLVQLERPEASVVIRASREENRHRSGDDTFRVGANDFDGIAINYLSAVWPFRMNNRNWVFSMNYQEAYDFRQEFTADLSSSSSEQVRSATSGVFKETKVDRFDDGTLELTVTSRLETRVDSILNQALRSQMVSELEFTQEGIIDAISPALAVEITPKLSVGISVNVYRNDIVGDDPIQTSTRAVYAGESTSDATMMTTRSTTGDYEYEGVLHVPSGGGLPPVDIPISRVTGTYSPFSDTAQSSRRDRVRFEGIYEEVNTYDDLGGENVTLGLLYTINRFLGVGMTLDTGWRAEALQKRTVRNRITTYASDGVTPLLESLSTEQETRRVEFNFPLYWAVGLVGRWTHLLHSTLDVSQTQWSDFWYRAAGEGRVNPLDGSPYGVHRLDDCWSVRLGSEYLLVLPFTELPLRCGLSWEQRPAIGSPDEFWGASLGSGIALGREPGRVILDIAYMYSWGDNVLGSLVPSQEGLSTDVSKHQGYVSAIWHF